MSLLTDWQASNGEVAVAGLERSGAAAVRLLTAHGIAVYGSDQGAPAGAATLGSATAAIETGRHDLARISRAMALVVSPGIPPEAAVIRAAQAADVVVIAEAALGLDAMPTIPWIGVTGTNGKTTTTGLIDHLLRTGGRRSVAAGNIGLPLSEVAVAPTRPEWLAVELSSFQLHDMPVVRPVVGVLTNLSPDHLDRYPNLAAYYADKARLFQDATADSIWISNLDDPASREMVQGVAGRHFAFSVAGRADAWYDRDAAVLRIGDEAVVPRSALPLLGDHNVANALAAALAVHLTGVPLTALGQGLASAAALPHRLEPVGVARDISFINDSKATNVASTRVALEAMDRPYVLLIGGRHKGEPYTSLAEVLGRVVAVVTYGESAALVEADLRAHVPHLEVAATFDAAFGRAAALAPAGGVVLLSPACSSYDMFDNYAERGARFRALVGAL